MSENRVKDTLAGGGLAVGLFVSEFGTTGMSRTAAAAGADFLVFDLEHTGWSMETARVLAASSRADDVVCCVRVPAHDYHFIARTLDTGAMGVMVPRVETEEQARSIVASAKYPPLGVRGFGLVYEDQFEGDDVGATISRHNERTLVIAQIETALGAQNVEAIANVDGVDVLWIGHFDLTSSLGIPGELDHPLYREAVDKIARACHEAGKAVGAAAPTMAEGHRLLDKGFRCLAYSEDILLLQEALSAGLADLRKYATDATRS